MKRPWKCIALLTLFPSTASSLSQDRPKKQASQLPPSPVDLDPLQQAITTSTNPPPGSGVVDKDLFAQVVVRKKKGRRKINGSIKNIKRSNNENEAASSSQIKSPAPFVDSTLLRFMSEQKRQAEATGKPPEEPLLRPSTIPKSTNAARTTRERNPTWDYLEGLQQAFRQQTKQNGKVSSTTKEKTQTVGEEKQQQQQQQASDPVNVVTPPTDTRQTRKDTATKTNDNYADLVSSSGEGWDMGQYNANRVATLLLETSVRNSVSEKLAMQAGVSVQNYVLQRTARRRVRDFLKKRDQLWAQGGSGANITITTPSLSSSSGSTTTTTSSPSYGIEDVLRFLREKGLTTNDVAVILCHTPSIALMMPTRAYGVPLALPEDEDGDGEEESMMDSSGNIGNDHEKQQQKQQLLEGETLEETFQRAFQDVLQGSLQIRRTPARKILRGCPGMLTMRGSKRAEEVLMLLTSLGVSTKKLGRDYNSLPALLSRSPSSLFRLVSFLTGDAIRMPVKSIGPMLRRHECRDLLNAVSPNLLYLTEKGRDNKTLAEDPADFLWVSDSDLRRKQLDKTYKRMRTTACELRDRIGTKDLIKAISAYPSLLLLSTEEQILPNARFLIHEVIRENDLPTILRMFPTVLGMDIEKMQESVDFLKYLGISDESLSVIFRAFPKLLTMDVEKDMMPVVRFLADEVGVAHVGRFVERLPSVLGYDIERELRPKWDYLTRVCMHPVFEVSRFPAFFSYPFDKRIKTRYEYLRFVKNMQTQVMAVDSIVRYGDKDFCAIIAKDRDGGKLFKRYVEYRSSKLASVQQKKRRSKQQQKNEQTSEEGDGKRRVVNTPVRKQQQQKPQQQQRRTSEKPIPRRRRPPGEANPEPGPASP